MSIFDSAYQWPDKYKACGAPHQSPVNLSQSFALPCERLCEWTVEDSAVGIARVHNATSTVGGIVLEGFQNGTPTATFNGDGYTCGGIVLFPSGQHSLEGVFADAELVCLFTHPGGKTVCMSVHVRSSPGDTASSKFFNAFVPYANNPNTVNLGREWSLLDVVPDVPSYYIYTGTTIWPACQPDVTWIVYSNTVTIDPSDYAILVRNSKPARRPLEEVGDREVTFFDAQGMTTPRDGKMYMRCRRLGKSAPEVEKPSEKVGLGGISKEKSQESLDAQQRSINNASAAASAQYQTMGGLYGILAVLLLVGMTAWLFFTSSGKNLGAIAFFIAFVIPNFVHNFWSWLLLGSSFRFI